MARSLKAAGVTVSEGGECGDGVRTAKTLGRLLRLLAEPGGECRIFIDEVEAVCSVLMEAYIGEAAGLTPLDEFASRIVSMFNGVSVATVTEYVEEETCLASRLMDREVEMLAMMHGGLRHRKSVSSWALPTYRTTGSMSRRAAIVGSPDTHSRQRCLAPDRVILNKLGREFSMNDTSFARRILASSASLALAFGIQSGAMAQTAENSAEVNEGDSVGGDIIVTAQRRSERLNDVPMSITAINAEGLARSGVNDTADLAKLAPGLTIGFYSTNLSPAIRGITGTGGNLQSTSAVPLYLDGVYQPSQLATFMSLPDVEQIEVLKGPQGTLYGQGSTGGAIIVQTRAPSFTPTGKFSASYGNFNAVNVRGFVSAPLSDGVAFSLSGDYLDRDGFRTNFVTGERSVSTRSRSIRGKLLVEPSDAVKITVGAYYTKHRDSSSVAYSAYDNNSIGYLYAPTAPKNLDPDKYGVDPRSYVASESYGTNLKMEISSGIGDLVAQGAYLHTKSVAFTDQDASPINYYNYVAIDWSSRHYTGTIDFASDKFGAFSFNTGVFYLDTLNQGNGGASYFFNPNGTVVPSPGMPVFVGASFTRQEKQVAAVYFEGQLDLTDRLHLTAGGRYNHEKIHAYRRTYLSLPAPTPLSLPEYAHSPASFSQFSPRGTLRYEVTPTSNVYASISRGFRGGGFSIAAAGDPPFRPETITAYEVGFKGRPIDALTVTLAAFRYDYKDMQVLLYSAEPGKPAVTFETNAASARSKGFELEANLTVTPELSISGGLAYLNARYKKFTGAQAYAPNATGTGNIKLSDQDLSGRRLLRSPEWSGNVSVNYEREAQAGKFSAFAAITFSSSYGLDNDLIVQTGSFARLDGELSFAPTALDGVRFVLWGKNLTDRQYPAASNVNDFGSGFAYNDPRTFGARVEFSF